MNEAGIEFDWDEANIAHIARHGVQSTEAEEVVRVRVVTAFEPIKRLIQFYFRERGN